MLHGKTIVAAVAATGIAAASLFAAVPASAAMAPAAHRPTICIFLPLCQGPVMPMKPKPKPHHAMHIVKKAPKKKPT